MLLAAACARPPASLDTGPYAPVQPGQASAEDRHGERVRWGGTIATVELRDGETCFDVISQPLDGRARPYSTDQTFGRFRACAPGFYDPGVYTEGRRITVTGSLGGTVAGRVGDYQLDLPLVGAETVYLWPPARPYPAYAYAGPYWAWGYPYPYGWGRGWGLGFRAPFYRSWYPYAYYRRGPARRGHAGGGKL